MTTDELKLRPLVEAIEDVTSRRVSLQTAIRWGTDGRCGVLLQRQRVGGRWFTTRAWVREFLEATSEAAESRLKRSTVAVVAGQQQAREVEKQLAADRLKKRLNG